MQASQPQAVETTLRKVDSCDHQQDADALSMPRALADLPTRGRGIAIGILHGPASAPSRAGATFSLSDLRCNRSEPTCVHSAGVLSGFGASFHGVWEPDQGMFRWIFLAAIVLGAALWWMDEIGFDEDSLDMRWRRRIGIGNIGVVFMTVGLAGLIFGP